MIVIAGKNEIAVHGLKLALDFFEVKDIVVVVNAADSGKDGWQPSLLKYALESGVAVKTIEEVYALNVDVFISLEFDKIVQVKRISTGKVFNIHFSLLPKYKGMYTSIWPVLFGDKESGVTLHHIDSGIDTGAIYSQKKFMLNPQDRSQDCYRKYISASKALLSENFEYIVNGFPVAPSVQLAEYSSYYSKSALDFKEVKIDFRKSSWEVKRQILAFGFRPYQFLTFDGRAVVNAEILHKRSHAKPGVIVDQSCPHSVTVATVDYDIRLFYDGLAQVLIDIPTMDILDLPIAMQSIAGVNDRNEKGWSPIIVAAYHGRLDIVMFLLQCGADINDTNYKGTTLLMYAKDYALKSGDASIVKFLLASGADRNLRDFAGKTIYQYVTSAEADFLGLNK